MQDMIFPFEFLGDPPPDSSLYKWGEMLTTEAKRLGRPWNNVRNYKRWLEEIGFEDVVEKKFYWPINSWAKGEYYKQIALHAQKDVLNGLDGFSLKIMGLMGWSAEDIDVFLAGVRKELVDPAVHCYVPV